MSREQPTPPAGEPAFDAPPIAGVVAAALRERGLTVATAESCTAGLVSAWLTVTAGSSAYFLGGFVTYADAAKEALIGVPAAVLRERGAVSAATAEAMAVGARARLGADIGVSVTGIAGPDGGTPEKPVGLVYIGVASAAGVTVARHLFAGTRGQIRWSAAVAALEAVSGSLARTSRGTSPT